MIIIDANLLIYATNRDDSHYGQAKEWLQALFSQESMIGLPWVTLWAYLRVVTNQKVFPRPLAAETAFSNLEEWLGLPNVFIPQPGPRHARLLQSLVEQGQAAGPLLSDAALAAIAIENSATLATTDRDFSRFAGLSTINPIAL